MSNQVLMHEIYSLKRLACEMDDKRILFTDLKKLCYEINHLTNETKIWVIVWP